VWVIGGAEVDGQAIPLASCAVVTEIDADFEGDAFAPTFSSDWQETKRTTHMAANGLTYSLITLTHKR
jgi:dihydrofolate reductase